MNNLTNEQLVEIYQNGNDYAASILWENNFGLIKDAIIRFKNYYFLSYEDKLSACHLAFTRSIKKYNNTKTCKFSTYLYKALNSAIIREADLNNHIRDAKKLRDSTVSYNALIDSDSKTEFLEKITELGVNDEYFSENLGYEDNIVEKAIQYATEKTNELYKFYIPKVFSGELTYNDVCTELNKSPQALHYQLDKFRNNVCDYINLYNHTYTLRKELVEYFNISMIDNKKKEFIDLFESKGLKTNGKIRFINDILNKYELPYNVILDTKFTRVDGKGKCLRYWKLIENKVS